MTGLDFSWTSAPAACTLSQWWHPQQGALVQVAPRHHPDWLIIITLLPIVGLKP
jgi:hypothetical protein